MTSQAHVHDVALSYAGEQREYVGHVAQRLKAEGVDVFFDDFEQRGLWGQDLAVHFDQVYRTGARFVVPFVSTDYAAKAWPRLEFRSALAKAVEAKEPYILPVRFDDTELPGLRPTIHYLDARKLLPEQIAEAIIERLGRRSASRGQATHQAQPRLPKLPPSDFNPYEEAERAVSFLREDLSGRAQSLQAQGLGVHAAVRNERFILRIMRSGRAVYSLDIWIGGDWGDNTIAFSTGGGASSGTNAHGTIEWDRERGLPVVKLLNLSLLPEMGGQYRLTPAELSEAIWEELCRRLENELR